MILLSITKLGEDVEASLTTRWPHPAAAAWSWVFELHEVTDESAVKGGGLDLMPGVLGPSSMKVHVKTSGGKSVLEKHRALLMLLGQHPIEVERPSLVHRVLIDLAKSGGRLEHQVDVVGVSGKAYPLWSGLTSPAVVKALSRTLGLPSSLHVRCVDVAGDPMPLPPSVTQVLQSYLVESSQHHLYMEGELRHRERARDDRGIDANALMNLLRRALSIYGPTVEHGSEGILIALPHSQSSATISMSLKHPFPLSLTASITAPPGCMAMNSPEGLVDLVRNWRDPQCGVFDVDEAFVITADDDAGVALAGALARAATKELVELGRGTSVRVVDGTLDVHTSTSDPHLGALVAATLRLVRLWERLLLTPPTLLSAHDDVA